MLLARPLLLVVTRAQQRLAANDMLTAEELADLRGVSVGALEGVCSLLRSVKVAQPNHSWRTEEQTIASDVPCRKVPTNQTPQELSALSGQTQNNRVVTTFLLPATQAVYSDDILLYNGKRYPVAGVGDRTDGMYSRVYVYDDSKAP